MRRMLVKGLGYSRIRIFALLWIESILSDRYPSDREEENIGSLGLARIWILTISYQMIVLLNKNFS